MSIINKLASTVIPSTPATPVNPWAALTLGQKQDRLKQMLESMLTRPMQTPSGIVAVNKSFCDTLNLLFRSGTANGHAVGLTGAQILEALGTDAAGLLGAFYALGTAVNIALGTVHPNGAAKDGVSPAVDVSPFAPLTYHADGTVTVVE